MSGMATWMMYFRRIAKCCGQQTDRRAGRKIKKITNWKYNAYQKKNAVLQNTQVLEPILAKHLGCEILLLKALASLLGHDSAAGCLPFSEYTQQQNAALTEPVSKYATSSRRNTKRSPIHLFIFSKIVACWKPVSYNSYFLISFNSITFCFFDSLPYKKICCRMLLCLGVWWAFNWPQNYRS